MPAAKNQKFEVKLQASTIFTPISLPARLISACVPSFEPASYTRIGASPSRTRKTRYAVADWPKSGNGLYDGSHQARLRALVGWIGVKSDASDRSKAHFGVTSTCFLARILRVPRQSV